MGVLKSSHKSDSGRLGPPGVTAEKCTPQEMVTRIKKLRGSLKGPYSLADDFTRERERDD